MSSGARYERAAVARLATMLAACAALVCCATTVTFVWQEYDGPSRSKDSIAVVRSNGASPLELIAIDGKAIRAPLEHDDRLHVEVLPGVHDIDVAAPSIGLRHVVSVRLLAEAGKVYRVEVSAAPASNAQAENGEPPLWQDRWVAHAYEVDRDTDAVRGIADAPAAPAAPAPATRPRSREGTGHPREGGDDAGARDGAYDAERSGDG